jgi:hypothetical protein
MVGAGREREHKNFERKPDAFVHHGRPARSIEAAAQP